MIELNYGQTYMRLNCEVACIVFFKKTGELRTMLSTRSSNVARMANCGDRLLQLTHRDSKCTINNGSIAVIDLILGEVRSFGTDRVAHMEWLPVENLDDLDKAVTYAQQIEAQYKKASQQVHTLDGMDMDFSEVAGKAFENVPTSGETL